MNLETSRKRIPWHLEQEVKTNRARYEQEALKQTEEL